MVFQRRATSVIGLPHRRAILVGIGKGVRVMLNEAQFYRQQALRCEERLPRISDPRHRNLVERERRDWFELADRAAVDRPREPRATGNA